MTAKLIHLPRRYPAESTGVAVFREDKAWTLRRSRAGAIQEMAGLTTKELQDIYEMAGLALRLGL